MNAAGAVSPPPGRASAFRIRPYTLTGGRTSPTIELSTKAEVRVLPTMAVPDGLGPGQRRVLDLVDRPTGLAELATRAEVPLPVVRVLIGDLAESGLVVVDEPAGHSGRPDIRLLQKVLEGLQPQ